MCIFVFVSAVCGLVVMFLCLCCPQVLHWTARFCCLPIIVTCDVSDWCLPYLHVLIIMTTLQPRLHLTVVVIFTWACLTKNFDKGQTISRGLLLTIYIYIYYYLPISVSTYIYLYARLIYLLGECICSYRYYDGII